MKSLTGNKHEHEQDIKAILADHYSNRYSPIELETFDRLLASSLFRSEEVSAINDLGLHTHSSHY